MAAQLEDGGLGMTLACEGLSRTQLDELRDAGWRVASLFRCGDGYSVLMSLGDVGNGTDGSAERTARTDS